MKSLLLLIPLIAALCAASYGREHVVGDSIWSIHLSYDFYTNWLNDRSFAVGDSLVFRFETGFYDVVLVSRREYQNCDADNPFQTLVLRPATIPLREEGMHYFICSFDNYCRLGQKVAVPVQRHPSH